MGQSIRTAELELKDGGACLECDDRKESWTWHLRAVVPAPWELRKEDRSLGSAWAT